MAKEEDAFVVNELIILGEADTDIFRSFFNLELYVSFADGKIFISEGEPKYDFFGHKVFSPFGIPAGPLINGKFVASALDKGFDIATYKTVRTKKYPCHEWPNVLSVSVDGDLTLEKAEEKLVDYPSLQYKLVEVSQEPFNLREVAVLHFHCYRSAQVHHLGMHGVAPLQIGTLA